MITPFYAALFGIGLIWLSLRVVGVRYSEKVSLGVGESARLERRVRAHGNFCEFVPLGLLLIYFVEITWKLPALTHALALALLAGRFAHAYALSGEKMLFSWRKYGMILTLTSISAASAALLLYAAKGAL
jgi:uncharacterized protein